MSKHPVPFLVTTAVRKGGEFRTVHMVYAKSERAATSEAIERERQAWAGEVQPHVVSVQAI